MFEWQMDALSAGMRYDPVSFQKTDLLCPKYSPFLFPRTMKIYTFLNDLVKNDGAWTVDAEHL